MPIMDIVRNIVGWIGAAEPLDKVAKPVAKTVQKVVPPGPVKDALSGTWLGHPVHPLATDVVIGAWTSALVLDLVGGERSAPAAKTLTGLGILSAVPTAAAGLSDWSDSLGKERRIGLVHAGANITALVLYSLSYLARRNGDTASGKALGLAGATVVSVGGYLGGHLVFRLGVWVDRNAWTEGATDWQAVADEAELDEGKPVVVHAGDQDVLLVRLGGQIHALGDTCSHAGGPLHEGSLSDGCVTCPWHGSQFRLSDGHLQRGPATGHQPAYDARVDGGKVSVRRR
ncbi:MAG: Rieske 2Fe-2S domain-containing protein [Egibacteraceae bacterium]